MVKMMAYKKSLGMGLDLLLAAADQNRAKEPSGLKQAREIFATAVQEDTRENFLEAYYWYRRVIDCSDAGRDEPEFKQLLSQSFNNAAVIANEYGNANQARAYLERALEVQPDNVTAQENLKIIAAASIF